MECADAEKWQRKLDTILAAKKEKEDLESQLSANFKHLSLEQLTQIQLIIKGENTK